MYNTALTHRQVHTPTSQPCEARKPGNLSQARCCLFWGTEGPSPPYRRARVDSQQVPMQLRGASGTAPHFPRPNRPNRSVSGCVPV